MHASLLQLSSLHKVAIKASCLSEIHDDQSTKLVVAAIPFALPRCHDPDQTDTDPTAIPAGDRSARVVYYGRCSTEGEEA